jgi:hypothetical protein
MNTSPENSLEADDVLGEREHNAEADGEDDTFQDLLAAAQTSLEFWDNPLDDEDWNGTYIK